MDDKELIWVTKEQAKTFKDLETDISKKNFVDKLIKERKLDIQYSIESLDDDLLRLKAFALTYKTELSKVYEEQDKVLEELWETHASKIYELKQKIQQLKPDLEKVAKEIGELNKSLSNVSTYAIDRLVEVVHKVNSMSDADKKLMTDLIDLTKSK